MNYIKKLSKNYNPRGGKTIKRLTVHCAVGQLPAQKIADIMEGKNASSTWVIGYDGTCLLNVEEINRPWTSDSRDNDYQAITIECASDLKAPYAFNDKVYDSLVKLTVDICKRYNKHLVYIPDKNTALKYEPKDNELLVTFHRWFANVECPGGYFIDKAPTFVNQVNHLLDSSDSTSEVQKQKLYRVQIGAFRVYGNAEACREKAKKAGFTDAFIVEV